MLVVAAILREDIAVTLRFAAWYLEQGADRVCLYLDNPDDPARAQLEAHARIDVVACTPDFWQSLGLTPATRFTRRQNAALTHAYRGLPAGGWLLNVDADELVWFKDRTLADVAAGLGAECRSARILPAEAIHVPGMAGHHFRLPMKRWARLRVYGEGGNVLVRRSGLVGHHVGKSLTRTGLRGVSLRQHWAQTRQGEIAAQELGPEQGAYLLHFFDRGYESWRAKLEWRLESTGFRPPVKEHVERLLAGSEPEAALRALYADAHIFAPERLALLDEVRAALTLDVDFDAPVARHFAAL